ncbi:MAG: 23S rRNA (pseudouridine(1915)-N(3))-methyltransferase RlmH [Patescibacteria group bacterium]|nr:23S rRNA (pseudouridine(1915)-N(3))-methyltransferase RlmH [Patescibacteria group bacterium]
MPTDGSIVALDRTGTRLSSEKLAALLNERGGTGQTVTFIIGGAAGLAAEVVRRADFRLSLSDLTLTHEMARVFLIEQLYRAAMINSGKKYHY